MNAQAAAEALLKSLRLPAHAASIWPWHGNQGITLIVKLAPEHQHVASKVPDKYHGYAVKVETRIPPNAKNSKVLAN